MDSMNGAAIIQTRARETNIPIKIGIAGIRGLSIMKAFEEVEDAKVVAFCDIGMSTHSRTKS